jgi:integrase
MPKKPKDPILTPLPPRVRVKNGAYHYDCGRDDTGKRSWRKLCRIDEGHHALYRALADITSPRSRTLNDLFDAFLARGIATLAPATQRDYAGYIARSLRKVFGATAPDEVHSGHISQYLQRRLDGGSGVVANREIACLSSVYNYGMRTGRCNANPCHGVRRNAQPPRTRYVEHDEFRKVFDAVSEPFQDFLAALYLTGLRQQDIRSMKRSQITPQGLRVTPGKTERSTGKTVLISMTDALRFFIIRAQTRAPSSPFVFTNENGDPWGVWAIQSQVRRVRERIGRHDWTLHDIRGKAESDHSVGLGLLPLYRRVQRITPVR